MAGTSAGHGVVRAECLSNIEVIMATKTKTAENSDTAPAKSKTTAQVTYHPGDGDPPRVTWGGLEFKAYVPVAVPLTHAIAVPMRKQHVLADGTVQSRNIETKVSLVELARGNPAFSVDGARAERKVATASVPTTNDEYRGYCIAWIAASTDAAVMDKRWDAEAELREQCGVEEKDLAYLRPFFEAHHRRCGSAVA
jgi:hypothetical protein